jgi:hypothetical protein
MKKYTIELNEKQLELLNEACDVTARIYRGIPDTISLFDNLVWENEEQRDEMEIALKYLRKALNPTHSTNRVAKNGEDQILFDMHTVIRNQFYLERQKDGKVNTMGVDAFVTILGSEPKITISHSC